MMNPTLADLIGGIQSVTLSDEEARRRGTQKSILERKAPPTFDTIIEIIDREQVAVHKDVAATVDQILRGAMPRAEIRRREEDGGISVSAAPQGHELATRDNGRGRDRQTVAMTMSLGAADFNGVSYGGERLTGRSARAEVPLDATRRGRGTASHPLRIYAFGVSRNRLEQAIQTLRVPAAVVREPRDADIVLTLKNYFRQKAQPIRDAELRGVPVYVLRSNTAVQMEQLLASLFPAPPVDRDPAASQSNGLSEQPGDRSGTDDPLLDAISEAEQAITAVMNGSPPVQLRPQGPRVRQVQHQLAERYALASRSRGREPNRRVEISRDVSS
jgi:hypothetical protein